MSSDQQNKGLEANLVIDRPTASRLGITPKVIDNTLCSFRLTGDSRVLLPVMVHLDGFHLTHMIEPMLMPDQEEVDRFLPPYSYPTPLDPTHPMTMGVVGPSYIYTEAKRAQVENLEAGVPADIEALRIGSRRLVANK